MQQQKKWFVVYTIPRWEKKVAATLAAKDVEHYCPLNKVSRQWSDRKKIILEPLFKGYVFVYIEVADTLKIKNTAGIINFIYWNGKPAVVKSTEIETIRKFMDEFTEVTVTGIKVKVNDAVLVKQGLLMDFKGIVLEIIGNKARVKIQSMGLQLTAIFDRKNIIKL